MPEVPLAVWSTPIPPTPTEPTPGGGWTVPPLLAQRLLAVYSQPGSTVLTAGGSAGLVARTAARLGRHPAARGRRLVAATVDLLVATPPLTSTSGEPVADVADRFRRWAQLLRPAGVLAVVLPPTRQPGEPAATVPAAAGAGLAYLQHVVALLWPLHEDHLDPPAAAPPPTPALSGTDAMLDDEQAFADILLFTAPGHAHQPSSADTGPAGGPTSGNQPSTDDRHSDDQRRAKDARTGPRCPASGQGRGSVWLAGQTAARAQRGDRYTPGSVAHPARMMPALARMVIEEYTKPGQLVLDPMCGIGTTMVEAVHAGRDAVGVEYEPRWSSLARDNLDRSVDQGATGHGAVRTGDARHTAALLGSDVAGRVRLLLTSPPYGSAVHGRVEDFGDGLSKWYHRYGADPANLAHRPLPELLDGFAEILRACLPLLAPGATVVVTARPYRVRGRLVDLPGAALHTATTVVGLQPVGRYVALLAGLRAGQMVPRASFFQMANARTRQPGGHPLLIPAHEDVLTLVYDPSSVGGTGRDLASPDGVVERTGGGDARGAR